MKFIVILLIGFSLYSCRKKVIKENKGNCQFLSEWKYTGYVTHDGGGGVYNSVYEGEDMILRFIDTNTIELNHHLCGMPDSVSNQWHEIMYDTLNIFPTSCPNTLTYQMTDTSLFIISYCFEGCDGANYIKIN